MAGPQLWIDGRPASTLSRYGLGELTWSHAADGGCKEASWKMDLPPSFSHPSFARNKRAEVRLGALPVWSGILTEPTIDDDGARTFTGVGLSVPAVNGYLALDGSGNASFTPDEAIDAAIARGLPWTRPTSISNVAFRPSTSTDTLLYLGALLDAWAEANGKRWGVNALGEVYAAADPTIPDWYLSPQSSRFGLADDDYASDLFIRYVSSSGTYSTATVGDAVARSAFGRREYAVDATGMGLLTGTGAQGVGNGLLSRGKARQNFTNGIEVSSWQLTTPGGIPAPLPLVRGQQLVRQFGVIDQQGQPFPYMDWVIGETGFSAGASTIGLNPVGLAGRDFESGLTAIQKG